MERELEEYRFQLSAVNESLEADPENESLLELKGELTDLIALMTTEMPAPAPVPARKPVAGPGRGFRPVKKGPEKAAGGAGGPGGPADGPGAPAGAPAAASPRAPRAPDAPAPAPDSPPRDAPAISTGAMVLARWVSGDKTYHKARVTGITGLASAPMYTVKFVEFAASDTVTQTCIKMMPDKRKAEATDDPRTYIRKTEVPKLPKPTRFVREKRELDEGKSKWQEFSNKGVKSSRYTKARKIGENSIFRSPDEVGGRVGFSNSGRPMTKDGPRAKHKYEQSHD
ncbi:uncharacterized protein V1510DRAFT_402222 [Dipodascopsis tothii]|uniref:uncharacterized protein n=1 Tax=Dipodascopsis tothii TaxID=44089 RepID=UPI0034CD5AF6